MVAARTTPQPVQPRDAGERQPGSSFKPFVLATALKEGIAPSSILTSSKHVTINADGRLWQVNNFEGEALRADRPEQGDRVFGQLGLLTADRARRPARGGEHGEGSGHSEPCGVLRNRARRRARDPRSIGRAYTAFADGGNRIDGSIFGNTPRAVDCLADVKNVCVEQNAPVHKPVLTSTQAETIDQMLQGVVQYGTGKAAAIPGWQISGKTGTTENYGDAWFVGYTPQLVVAVWVGYPNKLVPMLSEFHGHPVAGGTFPALIWKAFMTKAIAAQAPDAAELPVPAVAVCGAGDCRESRRAADARQRGLS